MNAPGRPLLRLVAPLLALASARAQTVLFAEDFEKGTGNWRMEAYWHLAAEGTPCLDGGFPSAGHCMWYGREATCSYDGAIIDLRECRLAWPFTVPANGGNTYLDFWSRSEAESQPLWDLRMVEVSLDGGDNWSALESIQADSEPWTLHTIDLSAFAGASLELRFAFMAGDDFANDYLGWLVDDVVLRTDGEVYAASCFGDGSATACPCGNASATSDRAGCRNSTGTAGALRASGFASLAHDSLRLSGSGMTDTTVMYYQGASLANGGAGVLFGDGINCTGGPLRRLGIAQNSGGGSSFPHEGGAPVSVRGQVLAPATRWYQASYRNAQGFCTPDTFNSTNQVRVDWTL